MKSLRAKIIKWKRGKSTSKNTRNDENSAKLFDAIYENNFELAKFLLEDGEVDANTKDDCGNTPLSRLSTDNSTKRRRGCKVC